MKENSNIKKRREAGFETGKEWAHHVGFSAGHVAHVERGYRQKPKWWDRLLELETLFRKIPSEDDVRS